MAADRVIRWTTAGAVIDVVAVAAMASYEHAYALVAMAASFGIWPQFRDAVCPVRAGGCARVLMGRLYPWLSHYRVK